jgi:hypothetical protein
MSIDIDLLNDVLLESLDWVSERTGYSIESMIPHIICFLSTSLSGKAHSLTQNKATEKLERNTCISSGADTGEMMISRSTVQSMEQNNQELLCKLQMLKAENQQVPTFFSDIDTP